MSITKTINGNTYRIPVLGDSAWGAYTTDFLAALVDAAILTGSAASKPLVAELDLGDSFGVQTCYVKSNQANPASSGLVRLANGDVISWRNSTNDGNISITVDSSNRVKIGSDIVPTLGSTDAFTNKTIDADNNTISNLEVDNLKSGVLDTDLSSVSSSDDTIPSAKATKSYVDGVTTNLNNHLNDTTDAHAASAIGVTPSGNISSTNVQNALVELQGDIDGRMVRFGSTTDNRLIKSTTLLNEVEQTGITVDDSNNVTGVAQLTASTLKATTGIEVEDPDAGTNKATIVADSTLSSDITLTLPKASGTLATLAGTEELTNKTLTKDTINDYVKVNHESTPTDAVSGGLQLYAKSDDKLYTRNSAGVEVPVGSGSGSSSEINYISNPTFEETANGAVPAGWATYADAAGAAPVDGTGGSPTVTFLASTSSPIRGLVSAVFTKDAANRQGEGAAYAFTIPAVDKGKLIGVNFDITPGGSYTSGDMSVYVYDVTNGALITPAAVSIPNNTGTFTTSFGLTAGTSYRLILHVASTNASAYTLKVDNVSVGYKPTPQGAVVEEWKTYTPIFGGFGTATNVSFLYRRVGTATEIIGKFNAGTPTSDLASISLPFGTIGGSAGERMYAGDVVRNGTNAPYRVAAVQGRTYMTFGGGTTQVTADYTGTGFVAAAELIYLHVTIPIAEWAGSGTVNLAQNDVEFAWNSSATASDDTTSFGYGPGGMAIQAFAPSGTTPVIKRVRTQSTIQTGDQLLLEWSSSQSGPWLDVTQRGMGYSRNDAGTTAYGAHLVTVSSNEVAAYFFSQAFVGIAWVSIGGYWRVRKTSAGAAVGFSNVVPGVSSGLVPAAGLPGRTDGQAVASGYVSEEITDYTSASCNTTTGATTCTITLTAGTWLVGQTSQLNATASCTGFECKLNLLGTSGTYFGDTRLIASVPSSTYATIAHAPRIVKLSSATADKTVSVTCIAYGATATVYTRITAVRQA